MTLTESDMKICKERNDLRRWLRKQKLWLQNPPYHLGITKADVDFEKKLYWLKYRKLEKLEWK